MKVGVALLAALILAGTAAAAQPAWTPRDAVAAARALAYPRPHAKKITCKGSGAFHCKAVFKHHRHKKFVLTTGTEGGWTCAGHTLHTCHVLTKGFLSTAQVAGMGGLESAAGYSAAGYVQEHYKTQPESAGSCSPVWSTSFQCPFSTPTATITISYRQVKDGWVVTGSG